MRPRIGLRLQWGLLLLAFLLEGTQSTKITSRRRQLMSPDAPARRQLGATGYQKIAKRKELLAKSKPATIRIKYVYHLQATGGLLNAQQEKTLMKAFLPAADAVLRKYIQVRIPSVKPIMPTPDGVCSFTRPIPEFRKGGPGFKSTDLVVEVQEGTKKDCDGGTYAGISGCDWNPVTERPTIACMVVCPMLFAQSKEEVLATLVHEMLHGLGFDSSWFPFWYDARTGEYYKTLQKEITGRGGNVTAAYLATPKVAAYAREFYNCSKLPGAPLDLESRSHWSLDKVPLDLMVPYSIESGQSSRMTRFTLHMLEDTGWYVANKWYAEEAEVGRGAGCNFVIGSCTEYIKQNPMNSVYCPPSWKNWDVCTPDYRGIGYCLSTGLSSCLKPTYYERASEVLSCTDAKTFLKKEDKEFLASLETVGGVVSSTSRCLRLQTQVCSKSSAKKKKNCIKHRFAMCTRTECNRSGQVVLVFKNRAQESRVTCTRRGEVVNLSKKLPALFSSGKVLCPLPEVVCPTVSCGGACGPKAWCWRGSCRCFMNYAGPNCANNLGPP